MTFLFHLPITKCLGFHKELDSRSGLAFLSVKHTQHFYSSQTASVCAQHWGTNKLYSARTQASDTPHSTNPIMHCSLWCGGDPWASLHYQHACGQVTEATNKSWFICSQWRLKPVFVDVDVSSCHKSVKLVLTFGSRGVTWPRMWRKQWKTS